LQGRNAEARAAMDRAVAAAGRNSEIVGYQGALYDLMGDFPAAIKCYSRAISLTSHAKPWIAANLGLTHLAVGRAAEAERIYRNVIDHYPNYVRAWIGLAVALLRRDRVQEAGHAAARVLELDPGFSASSWGRSRPFNNDGVLAQFMADMRAAGLPP
jgi:tetratricopeptide (TPR) repeat protein